MSNHPFLSPSTWDTGLLLAPVWGAPTLVLFKQLLTHLAPIHEHRTGFRFMHRKFPDDALDLILNIKECCRKESKFKPQMRQVGLARVLEFKDLKSPPCLNSPA